MTTKAPHLERLVFVRTNTPDEQDDFFFTLVQNHLGKMTLFSRHYHEGRYYNNSMGTALEDAAAEDIRQLVALTDRTIPSDTQGTVPAASIVARPRQDIERMGLQPDKGELAWRYVLEWADETKSGPGYQRDALLDALQKLGVQCSLQHEKELQAKAAREKALEAWREDYVVAAWLLQQGMLWEPLCVDGTYDYRATAPYYRGEALSSHVKPFLVGVLFKDERGSNRYQFQLYTASEDIASRTIGRTYFSAEFKRPSGYESINSEEMPATVMAEITHILQSAGDLGSVVRSPKPPAFNYPPGAQILVPFYPQWIFGLLWSDESETGVGTAQEAITEYLLALAEKTFAAKEAAMELQTKQSEAENEAWICPACGSSVAKGRFCPECGGQKKE